MEKQGRMRTSSSEQTYWARVASFSYQEDHRGNGNKPASGQSWTHQQWGLCLRNNIFKKWEKMLQNSWEKSEDLQTPRSEKKEGQELLQLQEQWLPCSPGWRPWWGKLSCRPWRSMVEQISTCSPQKTPQQSRWMCLKGQCVHGEAVLKQAQSGPLERSSCWNTSWKDLWPCGGPILEQSIPEGLQSLERTQNGEFHWGLLLVEDSMMKHGRVWRRNSRDNVWSTDCNPHSLFPWTAQREEVIRTEWETRREEGVRIFAAHDCILIWFLID